MGTQHTPGPRPYDLSDPREFARLLRELRGYLTACRRDHHGTDIEGRGYAVAALDSITPQQATFAGAALNFPATTAAG